jgi:hypothetical protein
VRRRKGMMLQRRSGERGGAPRAERALRAAAWPSSQRMARRLVYRSPSRRKAPSAARLEPSQRGSKRRTRRRVSRLSTCLYTRDKTACADCRGHQSRGCHRWTHRPGGNRAQRSRSGPAARRRAKCGAGSEGRCESRGGAEPWGRRWPGSRCRRASRSWRTGRSNPRSAGRPPGPPAAWAPHLFKNVLTSCHARGRIRVRMAHRPRPAAAALVGGWWRPPSSRHRCRAPPAPQPGGA